MSFCWDDSHSTMCETSQEWSFWPQGFLVYFMQFSDTYKLLYCIFSSTELVYLHLGKYLPPVLQEDPFWKKNNHIAFGYSLKAQFQNKFALTPLSYLRFYLRYCFFGNSKNVNWLWDTRENFTGWKKMRKFQPATQFRMSRCSIIENPFSANLKTNTIPNR